MCYFELVVANYHQEEDSNLFDLRDDKETTTKSSNKESSLSSYSGFGSYSIDVFIMFHRWFDNNINEFRNRIELAFDTVMVKLR